MPIPHDLTKEFFIESSDLNFDLTFVGENVVREDNSSAQQRVRNFMHLLDMIYNAYQITRIQNQENTENDNSSTQATGTTENSNGYENRQGISNLGRLDTDAIDFLLQRQRMRIARRNAQNAQNAQNAENVL